MKTHFLGMMNMTVRWNKRYIKWSLNPIRKQKAMLHNVTHTDLKIWIKLAKTNTKMTKKVKTTSTIYIRWLMICVYSVCGLFSGVWPKVKGQRRPIWGLHNKFKLNPISKLVMCRNCSTNQRPGNDWNSVEYDQGADHNVFVAKHKLHLISGLFANAYTLLNK